ncbi:MAG: DNRLRE domain-containing protein [Candidatus Thorarchaeota archaeon]
MNKSGVFLVIFILLLGIAVVPTESGASVNQMDWNPSMIEAAAATTGTMRIQVTEDVTVINGTSADSNMDGYPALLIGVADLSPWIAARAWLKFDLTHLPQELSIQRATINMHVDAEASTDDLPVGVYHCTNDAWELTGITWNNQPTFSATPSDVIDSPASPNMFIPMNWYAWDITTDVRATMNQDDMILTEVLKQIDETESVEALLTGTRSTVFQFNASYLEIEYTTPTTSGLTVDGLASGPILDYINTACPELGWTFSDPDYNDFQKDYKVQLWNNTYCNETLLWQKSHEFVTTIHDSSTVLTNDHPFGWDDEFRMQMKYPDTEIQRSGIVDKLYFTSVEDDDLIAQLENFEISLLMVPSAADLGADFTANREGRTPTIVMSKDSYSLTLVDNRIEIDIENTFFVNADLNLIIEIRHTGNTGDLIPIDRTELGAPGNVAYAYGAGESEATTATAIIDRTYDLKIGYLTNTVYSGIPASTNRIPFHTDIGYPGRFQIKYNQSYVNRAGYLDRAYFRVDDLSSDVVFENFTVTLVESSVVGPITNESWTANYGGATPYTVLDSADYTVKNVGGCLMIDFDNSFYYSNNNDLLIDIQWDNLVSGQCGVLVSGSAYPAYRVWDVQYEGDHIMGNGTTNYDLMLDFVNDEDSVPLEGCITLIEGERYYWRVRTCDSTGVWGDWATHTFKYETSTVLPTVTATVAVPSPAVVNEAVTVSVNATHAAGIYEALFEYDGANHSMTADGDTYSFTWTPTTVELVDYTVYIRSNENSWASASGSVNVTAASTGGFTFPVDTNTLLLILAAVAVVIVIIIVVRKKRK